MYTQTQLHGLPNYMRLPPWYIAQHFTAVLYISRSMDHLAIWIRPARQTAQHVIIVTLEPSSMNCLAAQTCRCIASHVTIVTPDPSSMGSLATHGHRTISYYKRWGCLGLSEKYSETKVRLGQIMFIRLGQNNETHKIRETHIYTPDPTFSEKRT